MKKNPKNSLRLLLRDQFIRLILLGFSMVLFAVGFAVFLMVADSMKDQEIVINAFVSEIEGFLNTTHDVFHISTGLLGEDDYAHPPHDKRVLLQRIKDEKSYFVSLYFMDASGVVLDEVTDSFSVIGLDLSEEIYFSAISQEAVKDDTFYISDPFISIATGQVSVIVSEGVWATQTGQFEGVLVGVLNLDDLQREIEKAANENEVVFVVDSYNKFVAHPDSVWVQEQRYYRPNVPFVELNDHFELVYEAELGGWSIRSEYLTLQGWTVVILHPVYNILSSISLLFLGTLGTIFIGIILSYFPYRRVRESLVKDLEMVVSRLDIVSQGDYRKTFPLVDTNFREIIVIYDSFTRMVNTIIDRDNTLEQRVAERTRELETVNKELEAFSYSVSHDLRAPLRAIDGFSHLLREDYGDQLGKDAEVYLDQISDNSHRMDQLISDLLSLSRVTQQPLSRTSFDLDVLARVIVNESLDLFDSRAIDFETTGNLEVEADQPLIRVLLTNLISNAYKFSQDVERCKIILGSVEGVEDEPKVYFIEDSGIGLDTAFAEKIFEPFQRLHSSNEIEGTGIGLAIVQRIVACHDGKIWVESVVGEGTTFFFTLNS